MDVVVEESSSIIELLASEDENLLIRGNSFLVLDLSFHVFDGVGSFNVESDGLASLSLNKDLDCGSKMKS